MPSSHARQYSTTGQQQSPLLQCAELQEALLSNKYVSQDQDVLLRLLQSCKGLRADVARQCAGQLTAVLREQREEHVAFASWLKRHAGLLQELEVQLPGINEFKMKPAAETLAGAMCQQQQHMKGLQRFTLNSYFWPPNILQHLPTSLKMLDLTGTCVAQGGVHALAPIARLQQLTELRPGPVLPSQLLAVKLPPLLQQLELTVDIFCKPQALVSLADWLRQHGRIVKCLRFYYLTILKDRRSDVRREAVLWNKPMEAVEEVLKVAAAPLAAAASAAPAKAVSTAQVTTAGHNASTAPPSSLRMQELHCRTLGNPSQVVPLPAVLLQHLPAVSLTQLMCSLKFDEPQHLAALCGLTALRSLEVLPLVTLGAGLADCSNEVLSPMSGLQQLTALKLDKVRTQQLAHLQLPQLRRLVVWLRTWACAGLAGQHDVEDDSDGYDDDDDHEDDDDHYNDDYDSDNDEQQEQQLQHASTQRLPLQLGHLTSLTYLEGRGSVILPVDELPSSLHTIRWDSEGRDGACSVQPLLTLTALEELATMYHVPPPPAEEMRQLTSLQRLTNVRFADYSAEVTFAAGTEPAWGWLPLTELKLFGSRDNGRHGRKTPCTLMPAAAVHALSTMTRLQCLVLEFNEHSGNARIRLDVTYTELAEVLQPLTALQWLRLIGLGLLGDVEHQMATCPATAEEAAQLEQQQQLTLEASDEEDIAAQLLPMQPASCHSITGIVALASAACSLPCLKQLRLQLPVKLQPGPVRKWPMHLDQQLERQLAQQEQQREQQLEQQLEQLEQQLGQVLQRCNVDNTHCRIEQYEEPPSMTVSGYLKSSVGRH